jgi:hypothetical protein
MRRVEPMMSMNSAAAVERRHVLGQPAHHMGREVTAEVRPVRLGLHGALDMATGPPDGAGDQAGGDGEQHDLVHHEHPGLDVLDLHQLAQQIVGPVGDEALERVDMGRGIEHPAERGAEAERRGGAREQHDLDRKGERTARDIGHEIEEGRAPEPGLQRPFVPVAVGHVAGQHDDRHVDGRAQALDDQHVAVVAGAVGDPADAEEDDRRRQQERQPGERGGQHHPEHDGAQRDGACLEGEREAVQLLAVEALAPAFFGRSDGLVGHGWRWFPLPLCETTVEHIPGGPNTMSLRMTVRPSDPPASDP